MNPEKLKRLIPIPMVIIACIAVAMAQADIPNSQDHPVITRYPGQTIRRYDVKEFDQYNLVLSVDKTGAPENVKKLGCVPGTQIKSLIPVLVKKGRAEVEPFTIVDFRTTGSWRLT